MAGNGGGCGIWGFIAPTDIFQSRIFGHDGKIIGFAFVFALAGFSAAIQKNTVQVPPAFDIRMRALIMPLFKQAISAICEIKMS